MKIVHTGFIKINVWSFAFEMFSSLKGKCNKNVKLFLFISFVMAVVDQEPDLSEIFFKVNGMIVTWMPS